MEQKQTSKANAKATLAVFACKKANQRLIGKHLTFADGALFLLYPNSFGPWLHGTALICFV